jgi:hypothetical protein
VPPESVGQRLSHSTSTAGASVSDKSTSIRGGRSPVSAMFRINDVAKIEYGGRDALGVGDSEAVCDAVAECEGVCVCDSVSVPLLVALRLADSVCDGDFVCVKDGLGVTEALKLHAWVGVSLGEMEVVDVGLVDTVVLELCVLLRLCDTLWLSV